MTPTALDRRWLDDQIAAMIEDDDELDPDDSLIMYGLDSIRVMEFVALLQTHGITASFEELIVKPSPNAWWALIAARRPVPQPA